MLSAEFVMKPTHRFHRGDAVDKVIERMNRYKVDTLYVVDDEERTEGFVRRRELEAIRQNGGGPLRKAIKADFPKTARFTPLNELYGLYESGIPVAVVGDTGRLLGVVYPLDLLATLAAAEEVAVD
ncbi:MAG: CBS domain-containing protein [Caldilineaceae bacterium]